MKKIALVIAIVLVPALSRAERFGIHVGLGSNFWSAGNLNVGIKLRALDYCPFGLEAVLSIPYGFEVMAPLYIVKTNKLKFHLILPFTGVHIPYGTDPRISVPGLKNIELYLVMGAGVEFKFQSKKLLAKLHAKHLAINLDWRMFMPNPIQTIRRFGDYGLKIMKKTAEEGELWIGITVWY